MLKSSERADGLVVSRFLADGTLVFVNEAYCSFFGKRREVLIGHNFIPFIFKSDQDKMRHDLESLNRGNPVATQYYRFLAANGKIRWLQWINQAIFDKGGNLTELQAVGQDITERKQAEEDLKRSEEKYRSLISNIPDVAWTSDENYRVIFVSPNVMRLTGYTQEEEYSQSNWMKWCDRCHPDDRENAKTAFKNFIKGKKPFDIEYRFQRKDGQWIWIHDRSVCVYEKEGKLYADGLITDITEHKKAEEETRRLREQAQLNSHLASIGQMAAGMAHEINNPLTSIIGLCEAVTGKDISVDTKKDLQIIHDEARRIANIVARLLTFARQHKPEQTYVDINEVIQTTLALRTYALETANIKTKTKLAPNLPRTIADVGQLQQVFLNIILNAETAIKSTHGKGNLIIKTEKIANAVRMSFEDDGPGIAQENLDRVFDPFYTTKPVGEGTGLGLSVCHGIITAHNGQIYVKSQLGKGATFIIELPVVIKGV